MAAGLQTNDSVVAWEGCLDKFAKKLDAIENMMKKMDTLESMKKIEVMLTRSNSKYGISVGHSE